jgi:hypothetical protein
MVSFVRRGLTAVDAGICVTSLIRYTAVLITGGCIFASSASANLLLNGGFEQPAIAANTYQAVTPTSWSGGALIHNGTVIEAGTTWPSPHQGNQFGDIGNAPGTPLSQIFSIIAGGNYMLTWYDNTGESGGLTTSPYVVTILDSSLNTVVSQPYDAYLAGVDNWQERVVNVSLSPGSYNLIFSPNGQPLGLDTLLDDVSLTANSVPEPSSVALLGVGLLGFAARCRRRVKNA